MIDYLIFNKLKWFNVVDNAESALINNKKYVALPSEVTLPDNTFVTDIMGNISDRVDNETSFKVVGLFSQGGTDYYVITGNFTGKVYGETGGTMAVSKSAVKNPKWGGYGIAF